MNKERYVAIDNVCAWPNLTIMPDGSLIATIFNQPTHGGWEGDVECWSSVDKGRTWRLCGVPAPHEPKTNRMNVAAGLAQDKSLIVLSSGWSHRNSPGNYSSPGEGKILPMWVCRSQDGGKSWETKGTVEPHPKKTQHIIPYGDIIILPEDTLGVCIYGSSLPDDRNAYFYTSTDDGLTWKMRGIIREGNTTETTALALPDGKLIAACRTTGDIHLELASSEDQGVTWNSKGPLTLGKQHPGHLLLLKDGRILLSYGIRNKGLYGIGIRISTDQGATWEPPRLLVDFETATDGGYPSSVEIEDGTIVTAYYCNCVPAHQRYHVGVVRWKVDE
ncbi:sialidase family protein [Verrucomicrobiota bacterium]